MLGFIKDFLNETKSYGIKIALDNCLISFTKWFIGAKRIQITYRRGKK